MNIKEIYRDAVEYWFGNVYRLDDYVISDGKRHPFALICPGGGYTMSSTKSEGDAYARELNKRGYSAFVLHYRCRKKGRYPAGLQDAARALQDILNRADDLKLETENYSLWGSSAGGHLAASFGTKSMGYAQFSLPKPGVLVLAYPLITMSRFTHKPSRYNLLGRRPSKSMIELTSVEKQITCEYPAVYLWCGGDDRVVDPENSRMLAKALAEHHIPYEYRKYSGIGHGAGLGKGLVCEPWFDEAVAFIEKQRAQLSGEN